MRRGGLAAPVATVVAIVNVVAATLIMPGLDRHRSASHAG
jgi:hypothetical protein